MARSFHPSITIVDPKGAESALRRLTRWLRKGKPIGFERYWQVIKQLPEVRIRLVHLEQEMPGCASRVVKAPSNERKDEILCVWCDQW
jgi:hypothetical protein